MNRRGFIYKSALLASGTLCSLYSKANTTKTLIQFGICADVHKDLVPDADIRLRKFITEAESRKVDFIVQLGDFCTPIRDNIDFLNIFKSFSGPKYHVIGNHDMDGGFFKDDTVKFWQIENRYYSFNFRSFHFIVLDGTVGNYPWTIDKDQLKWLEKDLNEANLPTIIFIHQPLEGGDVSNAARVRTILEGFTIGDFPKVIACFQGHRHTDYFKIIKRIPYIEINSMSYFWLGKKHALPPADDVLNQEYPQLKHFTRYKEALYGFVEIKDNGHLLIDGESSSFIDGTPLERGYKSKSNSSSHISSSITDRDINLKAKS